MMPTRDERIHACLDGELAREELTRSQQHQLDAMAEAVDEAAESVRGMPAPDLTARIMGALPELELAPIAPAPSRGEGAIGRVARWLWSPLAIAIRPAYGFAGAAVIAAAIVLAVQMWPQVPTSASPVAVDLDEDPALYVQFRIELPGASRVALAGSFTDWRPEYELTEVSPGVWSAMVPLHPGVHDYTFVIDGTRMVVDPHAPRVPDSFGGSNSRLFLPAPNGSA